MAAAVLHVSHLTCCRCCRPEREGALVSCSLNQSKSADKTSTRSGQIKREIGQISCISWQTFVYSYCDQGHENGDNRVACVQRIVNNILWLMQPIKTPQDQWNAIVKQHEYLWCRETGALCCWLSSLSRSGPERWTIRGFSKRTKGNKGTKGKWTGGHTGGRCAACLLGLGFCWWLSCCLPISIQAAGGWGWATGLLITGWLGCLWATVTHCKTVAPGQRGQRFDWWESWLECEIRTNPLTTHLTFNLKHQLILNVMPFNIS